MSGPGHMLGGEAGEDSHLHLHTCAIVSTAGEAGGGAEPHGGGGDVIG